MKHYVPSLGRATKVVAEARRIVTIENFIADGVLGAFCWCR
jgi:hypothetical protein